MVSSDNTAHSVASRSRPWVELTIKGLIYLASFWILGLSLYGTNNDLQLPLVQRAADPHLFPNDAFVSTLPHYASALWQVLWVPFRVLPETPVLAVLLFVQRLFWLYAAGRLARALTAGNRIAEIVAWCFCSFGMTPFVGWGTGLPDYFEHTSVAIACFLLTLALCVERRPIGAGVWLGVMGLCNIMHAMFGVVFLFFGLLLAPALRADKRGLLRGAGIAVLLMSPALWMGATAVGARQIDSESFVQLLWFYCPGHFFPSCWTAHEWIVFGLAGTVALGMCLVGSVDRSSKGLIAGISIGCLAFIAAARAIEANGSPALLTLQLARACDVWTCVAAVFVSASIADATTAARRRWILPAGSAGLVACAFLWKLHVWPWRPFDLLFVLVVSAATAMMFQRRRPWVALAAPLVPMVALMLLFGWSAAAAERPAASALHQPSPRGEVEAAQWAKRETPTDTVFLVDPEWGAFRSLSHRSSFLTWKEGAAILWYQPFAREWVKRMAALRVDPFAPSSRYPASRMLLSRAVANLDDAGALELARTFGLRYWLVPASKKSGLRVAYANPACKALLLQPVSGNAKLVESQ